MTKCGRYGMDPLKDFDYSPSTIRKSVLRSLLRLNTSYLDTVYLHDVEYVSNAVMPRKDGNHVLALTEEREAYGLAEGQEGKVLGVGDQKVLDGFMELRKMKDEGLIKNIGITGKLSLSSVIRKIRWLAHDIFLTFIKNKNRISTPYLTPTCASYLTFSTIHGSRCHTILLAPLDPERHIQGFLAAFHRASQGPTSRHCVPAQHGSPDSETARLASSAGVGQSCLF